MRKSRILIWGAVMLALAGTVPAAVSLDQAIKIGKDNFKRLVEQSHHYKVEYNQVFGLPVHSKVIWKKDFYLLYFLKDSIFQVEMEVDKENGKPSILSVGHMSQPYHELLEGTFCHKYFSVDSITDLSSKRFRLQPDSVRLVYFGVNPRLGKRGAIWEIFTREGKKYISMEGPTVTLDQIMRDMNASQYQQGNFSADSMRLEELVYEVKRLGIMTDSERQALKITPQRLDSLTNKYKDEMEVIYVRFPQLRNQIKLEDKK